ncbi:MAG: SDR family NAD(P)-dependent oxidoreductase [Steroidobacteraceae bacterium]
MSKKDFFDLYGPVALVTGASSGIGKSFAELLAAKGLDLVVVARRSQRLDELAARLQAAHGVRVTVHQTDLAQATAARALVDATSSLDIGLLISNAGFGLKGRFDDGNPKAMADMLMVNCHAPMLLARGFVPRLRARRKGGIIFTSSVEGLIGVPFSAAYAATKGFLNSLGEGLWGELTPEGIDVLTLCPGATATEAPGLQGIDVKTLANVMSPDEVAARALDNIGNGPVYIASDHYKAGFERLLAMPRRDALLAMAKSMRR